MNSLRILPAIAALACAPFALVQGAFAQGSLGGKPWNPRDQVNYSVFQNGTTSRIKTQAMFEIPTENDFQVYWTRSTGNPPQTAPKGIDWLREKLVAIHLGERPTGGYSVFVQNIERSGAYATIEAVARTPVPGQWVSQAVTSPFVIVKVDRIASQFRLSLTEREGGLVPGGQVIITNPGAVIVNPNDYGQAGGGGYVDPRYDTDWDTYTSGTRCHVQRGGLQTIDMQVQWNLYWSRMTGRPAHQAPGGVDWFKYRLVAVHLGTKPTGGFGVKVARVERNGVYGIIRAVEETPIPGTFVTQAQTSPYVIVRVPRNLISFKLDLTSRERGNVRVID